MTDLNTIVTEAEALAANGDAEEAERLLEKGAPLLAIERNVDVLARYASVLHDWGASEIEEQTLRVILSFGRNVAVIEQLVYLLIQKYNTLEPGCAKKICRECVVLISEIIESADEDKSPRRLASLYYLRGLRLLDLCRYGEMQQLGDAQGDILRYLDWLMDAAAVPKHLQRANLIAFAQVEIAELLLLSGQPSQAATTLEAAINSLESSQVPGWMMTRAYTLLDHAWSSSTS